MERQIKILKNAVQCKVCGEIIESKHRHDFVVCKCFRESDGAKGCAVDGGHDYLRRLGNPNDIINLSETRLFTDEERDNYNRQQELFAEQFGWSVDYME